jgi:recombination protein RecA
MPGKKNYKNEDLETFLSNVETTYGEKIVSLLTNTDPIDVEAISTGIPDIDNITGIGGFPRSRISEIFGSEGSLKTSLCLHTIAQVQKNGGLAGYVDAEHALNIDRVHKIGVNTDELVFNQPNNGEQGLEVVELMVKAGIFDVVVIDSVAALTPNVELDKDMGDSVMGVHAKLMSQAMRKLVGPIGRSKTAVIFINQTRAKIGFGSFGGSVTTGGNALKFYSSLRLEMKYVGQVTNSKAEKIAGKYKCTVVKNKLAVPYKSTVVESSENGIDTTRTLVETLIANGVLTLDGKAVHYKDKNLGKSLQGAILNLRKNQELKEELILLL